MRSRERLSPLEAEAQLSLSRCLWTETGDLTEVRTPEARLWIGEVAAIEDVHQLELHLGGEAAEVDVLQDAEVFVGTAEPAKIRKTCRT